MVETISSAPFVPNSVELGGTDKIASVITGGLLHLINAGTNGA